MAADYTKLSDADLADFRGNPEGLTSDQVAGLEAEHMRRHPVQHAIGHGASEAWKATDLTGGIRSLLGVGSDLLKSGFNAATGKEFEAPEFLQHVGQYLNQHWQAGQDATNRGDYKEAIHHALALMPAVGPILEHPYTMASKGDISGAIGNTIGQLATLGIGAGLTKGLKAATSAETAVTPAAEAATKEGTYLTADQIAANKALAEKGVPLAPDIISGSPYTRRVQATLSGQIGSTKAVAQALRAEEEGMQGVGRQLAAQAAPESRTAFQTGEDVRAAAHKTFAADQATKQAAYQDFEDAVNHPDFTKSVKVGEKETAAPTTIYGPQGQPIITRHTEPVMQNIATPVDLNTLKSNIAPAVDDINSWFLRNRPGQTRSFVNDLMEGPDTVSGQQAERYISQLKQLQSASSGLSDTGRMYAGKVLNEAIPEIEGQMKAQNPMAYDRLLRARELNKAYEATRNWAKDLLGKEPGTKGMVNFKAEPGKVFKDLIENNDMNYQALQETAKKVPEVMPQVARTVLEGALENPKAWNKLGENTKQLLFPDAEHRQFINQYMDVRGRQLARPQPIMITNSLQTLGLFSKAKGAFYNWAAAKALFSKQASKVLADDVSRGLDTGGGLPRTRALLGQAPPNVFQRMSEQAIINEALSKED